MVGTRVVGSLELWIRTLAGMPMMIPAGAVKVFDQLVCRMFHNLGTVNAPNPQAVHIVSVTSPDKAAVAEISPTISSSDPGRKRGEPRAGDAAPREVRLDTHLANDFVKLVRFSVVSIQRRHERVLESATIVVTDAMSRQTFAAWRIASYLQTKDRPPLFLGEERFLRVHFEVEGRWARESLRFESQQLQLLEAIERALQERRAGSTPKESMR